MKYSEILDGILRREKQIFSRHYVAPVVAGGRVRVRLDSFIQDCPVEGSYSGWGMFAILPQYIARPIRDADLWEMEEYCRGYPMCSLRLVWKENNGIWISFDPVRRLLIPLLLVEKGLVFNEVRAVFDGVHYWSFSLDHRADTAKAAAMREELQRNTHPSKVKFHWRKPVDWELYNVVFWHKTEKDVEPAHREIQKALTLGNAQLLNINPHNLGYEVRWSKGANQFSTVIDRKMSVVLAGLCLSGTDRQHDLISLASMMDERPGNLSGQVF